MFPEHFWWGWLSAVRLLSETESLLKFYTLYGAVMCTTSVEAILNTNKWKIHLLKSNEHNSPLPLYQVFFCCGGGGRCFLFPCFGFFETVSPYITLTALELAV